MGADPPQEKLAAKRIKKTEFAGISSLIQLAGFAAAAGIWYYGYQETNSPLKWHDPNSEAGKVWFIAGFIPLAVLVHLGNLMAKKYSCGKCGNPLADKGVKICPTCRAELT